MPDRLDEELAALGHGTPFPVDWEAYSRELLARLARHEAHRRWRTLGLTLAAMVAGAAAAWLIALNAVRPPAGSAPERQPLAQERAKTEERVAPAATVKRQAIPDPTPVTYILAVRRADGGAGSIRAEAGPESDPRQVEAQPFVRRLPTADGGTAEIRFLGFTPPGRDEGSGIAMARGATRF